MVLQLESSTIMGKIAKIRETALNTGMKRELVPTPFWEDTDGDVFLQDIGTDELLSLESLKKAPADEGVTGESLYVAALICRALVAQDESGQWQPVFTDNDRKLVAKMGAGMLAPLYMQVQKFFGNNPNAPQTAKNG